VASLRPVANKGDGKKGGVSVPLGKKQKDPARAAARNQKRRVKKLPQSSGNKRQRSTLMQQQPDLPPTNLDPVNPHLPGRL